MKKLLQHIDWMYIFGLVVLYLGYHFKDATIMSYDPLYFLEQFFTPVVVAAFIIGGYAIIFIEFIVSKHYYLLFKGIVNQEFNWFFGITVILGIITFLLQFIAGSFVLYFTYTILLLFFVIYVLVIKTTYFHSAILLYLVTMVTVDILDLIDINYDVLQAVGLIAVIAVTIGAIGVVIYQLVKRESIKKTMVFLLTTGLMLSVVIVQESAFNPGYHHGSTPSLTIQAICSNYNPGDTSEPDDILERLCDTDEYPYIHLAQQFLEYSIWMSFIPAFVVAVNIGIKRPRKEEPDPNIE